MARVWLDIDDAATRITLAALLQAEGHAVVTASCDLVIADDARRAAARASKLPTLVVSTLSGVPDAIRAMRRGVYGYILLPLQPGEAGIMVQRALGQPAQQDTVQPAAETLEDAEEKMILEILRQCKYNKTKAAKRLGIGRNTLWRKLKKLHDTP